MLREATNVADVRQNDDETKEMPTRLPLLARLSVKLELTLEIVGGLTKERKFTKGSQEGALGSLRRCLRWCFRRSLRDGKDDRRRAAVRRVAPRHDVTTSNGGGERCGGASDAENDASHASNVSCHQNHQRSDGEKGGIRGRAFECPRVNAPLPRFFFFFEPW